MAAHNAPATRVCLLAQPILNKLNQPLTRQTLNQHCLCSAVGQVNLADYRLHQCVHVARLSVTTLLQQIHQFLPFHPYLGHVRTQIRGNRLNNHSQILINQRLQVRCLQNQRKRLLTPRQNLGVVVLQQSAVCIHQPDEAGLVLFYFLGVLNTKTLNRVNRLHALLPVLSVCGVNQRFEILHQLAVHRLRNRSGPHLER